MTLAVWGAFLALILGLLALDLFVLHRRPHAISAREALGWTAMWVVVAVLFTGAIYALYEFRPLGFGSSIGLDVSGRDASLQYLTGYLVEKSLSLDNMFVIATIFAYFRTPAQYQHRVLFWGILGAIVMRGAMIVAGAALINEFWWLIYVFGALLFFSAVKMLVVRTDSIEVDNNLMVRAARRLYPVSSEYDGARFFTRVDGRLAMTPLMVVLLMVESADVVFAVDSIPAIFAVTRDPFIIFSSNVFAILGLRSLYFALAAVLSRFRYLKFSLAFVLAYIGVKMVLSHHYKIDTLYSLAVITGILALGVIASVIDDRRGRRAEEAPLGPDVERVARLTLRQARKVVIFVIGVTVLLLAIPVGLLPGPGGILVVWAGLAILSIEFVWAAWVLRRAKRGAVEVENRVRGLFGFKRRQTKPSPQPADADATDPADPEPMPHAPEPAEPSDRPR